MARKNLNDAIHGDRAKVRGSQYTPPTRSWDDFQREKSKQNDGPSLGSLFSDPDRKPSQSSSNVNSKTGGYNSNAQPKKPENLLTGSCFQTHPALKLPGTDLVIYGGSCTRPIVSDADVYIGFDYGMRFTQRSWPWKKGTEFLFEIKDFHAPDNFEEFEKLVLWTKKQLEEGKKVHCGCIGGHGRTGTFLSALVSKFGEKDAITYVRDNYCKRVVESAGQVKFLEHHYGIKPVAGAKEGAPKSSNLPAVSGGATRGTYAPEPKNGSIWSKPAA